MKNIILGFILILLVSCSKTAPTLAPINIVQPPVSITYQTLPNAYYVGKTSYQLKTAFQFVNIDSIRIVLGIRNKGIGNGDNNNGYVYVDMNGDGLEDIFYTYRSDGNYQIKPDVFLNKGNHYELDNSMLPSDYIGNVLTRKTLVGDFNNDSIPDLFMINHGWDAAPFTGETCTLLLSDKPTHKYRLGDLSMLPTAFWHGGASGDLNGDGNLDIIVLGGHPAKVLYGDGKGNFTASDWQYNAGDGYITGEIVDVNKDGQNDIILSGDEGRPAPARYSPSTIFWNTKNDFSKQTIIVAPATNGWGSVMDIAVGDIDGDGINEILLDRTGDITGVWYGGYNVNVYKSDTTFKSFSDVTTTYINNSISIKPQTTAWMYRMILYKTNDVWMLRGETTDKNIKTWKQDPITKIFN
jgi:hypothetical protein